MYSLLYKKRVIEIGSGQNSQIEYYLLFLKLVKKMYMRIMKVQWREFQNSLSKKNRSPSFVQQYIPLDCIPK